MNHQLKQLAGCVLCFPPYELWGRFLVARVADSNARDWPTLLTQEYPTSFGRFTTQIDGLKELGADVERLESETNKVTLLAGYRPQLVAMLLSSRAA
jgi:hypothetical protein